MGTKVKTLNVFAPAKINLYLHITGRRKDGYHTLDSLVAFADIGDTLEIKPSDDFSFRVKGPFADAFLTSERDSSPDSSNLVVRAVWALAGALKKDPHVAVTLTKNLPLASGMGGGSSDAAAVIWGLLEWWGVKPPAILPELLLSLGADVPVCFSCRPVQMKGIGEVLHDAPVLPEIPVLLVHPMKFCPTHEVFFGFDQPFSNALTLPESWDTPGALYKFLEEQRNDLEIPAASVVPETAQALDLLRKQDGCRLARMTGSGATCFGLFTDELAVLDAAEYILSVHPDWWVRGGMLNRPQRY